MTRSDALSSTEWHFRTLAALVITAMRAQLNEWDDIIAQQEHPRAHAKRVIQRLSRGRVVDMSMLRAKLQETHGHQSLSERYEKHEREKVALAELLDYIKASRFDEAARWLRDAAAQIKIVLQYTTEEEYPWVYGTERDRAALFELLANRFEAEKDAPKVAPKDEE